eukprot:scaffold119920_cov48-Phaeocystis_antarctica.AAC.2
MDATPGPSSGHTARVSVTMIGSCVVWTLKSVLACRPHVPRVRDLVNTSTSPLAFLPLGHRT